MDHYHIQWKGQLLMKNKSGTVHVAFLLKPEYYTGNTVARGGDEGGGLYDRLPPLHFSKLGLKFYHQN